MDKSILLLLALAAVASTGEAGILRRAGGSIGGRLWNTARNVIEASNFLLDTSTSDDFPVYCPADWVMYGAYCYKLFTNQLNYEEADSFCWDNHDAQLTSIYSEGEQQFHNTMIIESGLPALWQQFRDPYETPDQSTMEKYTNWAEKVTTVPVDQCMMMQGNDATTPEQIGKWMGEQCLRTNPFVCKKKTSLCPEGWDEHSATSTCLKVMSKQLMTFTDAKMTCEVHNAKLASIHNPWEQNYFTEKATNAGVRLWIGMTDEGDEGNFRNVDGSEVGFWSNWAQDQPDNFEGNEHCVHMYMREDRDEPGKWNDNKCDKEMGFICQKPQAPCPSGWTPRDKFCYLPAPFLEATYEEANQYCADNGVHATLVSITNLDEQKFIQNQVTRLGMNVWIGLDDKETEGTMVWKDGSPLTFENWPEIEETGDDEDCVFMKAANEAGEWSDTACDTKGIKTMCKMPMMDTNVRAPTPVGEKPSAIGDGTDGVGHIDLGVGVVPDGGLGIGHVGIDGEELLPGVLGEDTGDFTSYCPEGATRYGAFCYFVPTLSLPFAAADHSCKSLNAELTSIHSLGEQKFHEFLIRDAEYKDYWIALTDQDTEGTFVYTNGDKMDYANWATNQPNNFNNQDCVKMSARGTSDVDGPGTWDDYECQFPAGYICKQPVLSCPRGWLSNGDSCYLPMSTERLNYADASARCEGFNSMLTSVTSPEEQLFLTGLVEKNDDKMWIGLDDIETDGTMMFKDGSPLTYTNWGLYQPQTEDSNQDCVYLRPANEAGEWTDDQCTIEIGFICKKPKGPCPTGFMPRDKYCYHVSTEPVDYAGAERACEALGTTLTIIRNDDEQFFHEGAVKVSGMDLWIGLNDKEEEGTMTWISSLMGVLEPVTYTNWASGRPSAYPSQEDCVKMSATDDAKWYDVDCATTAGYICSTPMIDVGFTGPTEPEIPALQCQQCVYDEPDVPFDQPIIGDKEGCYSGSITLPTVTCEDESPAGIGNVHRCYTYLYELHTTTGGKVNGIKRGCVAVNKLALYSGIETTSNIDDIRTIFTDLYPPAEFVTEHRATVDFCDTDNCNTGLSTAGSSLQCYQCRYHEINGKPDDKAGDKMTCYNGIGLGLTSCSAAYGPLTTGEIYKCYTSPYEKTTAKGDVVAGVRRGCVAINLDVYGDIVMESNADVLAEIFDFTLDEGDDQKGTATFCGTSACNTADVTVTECDYCALMNPCPDWSTCINLDKESGWTCSAPNNVCPSIMEEYPEFSVRLTGGQTETEGLVEIYRQGAWGRVCSDGWNYPDASVICKELGYTYVNNSYFDYDVDVVEGALYITNVECMGNELSIAECALYEETSETCFPNIGVRCLPEPSSLAVRLMDGTTPNSGRLEVRYNDGEWGTVCDDLFDISDANVACAMLGFTEAETFATYDGPTVPDTMPILLDDLLCTGKESTLLACRRPGLGEHNCGHGEDVHLTCKVPTDGDLRLVGGVAPNEGRLEIIHEGEFATVCENGFYVPEANVVCKQLGFPAAERVLESTVFGQGTGNGYPHRIECTGTEESLTECVTSEYDMSCGHDEDVGVKCFTEIPELRLVDGEIPSEGRVEMFYDGMWGTVCDDGFTLETANVVCKTLGYTAAEEFTSDHFGEGYGPIILDDVRCTGKENNLMECNHAPINTSNCVHSEDIGVKCRVPELGDLRQSRLDGRLEVFAEGVWGSVCDDDWNFINTMVTCKQLGFKYANTSYTVFTDGGLQGPIWLDDVGCVGTEQRLIDCPANPIGDENCDHSEDIVVACMDGTTDIRLVGGNGPSEGRVEIMYNGEWGTVCDDSWDLQDAKVVCKSLGFPDAIEAPGSAQFGEGEGQIFLDEVTCTGTESNILECQHEGFKLHNCAHGEDAGVVCLLPPEGALRISPVDKRLEIYHEGAYGTICDDDWTFENSRVACRQMNMPFVNQSYTSPIPITDDTKLIWLDDVSCVGTETSLVDCIRNMWGDHNCNHGEDVTVTCLEDLETELRLAGGDFPNEGRLELLYNGKWGTICDDNFNMDIANVACRQLGYAGAESFNTFGGGSGPIYLDNYLSCEGTETHILECQHAGLGINDCSHGEDIGLVCTPDTAQIRSNECYTDPKARDYRGTVSVTRSGKTCQMWTSQEPQEHDRTPDEYPGFGLGEYNYCRNPDNEPEGAWCYTTDPSSRWEYCEVGEPVPSCGTPSEQEGSLRVSDVDGRLDIYHGDQWGTICDDMWDTRDALVACKQMGFRFLKRTFTVPTLPFASMDDMPTWMDEVRCQGTEKRLDECDFRPWGDENCSHEEDVGVECLTGTLCDKPLGMEDRTITDDQITASDYYTFYSGSGLDSIYSPEWGRLNEDWTWATHMEDTEQWIQVTFAQTTFVTGVITQGYSDAWVTSYKVEYTEDGSSWQFLTGLDGQAKIFEANTDTDTPVTNKFYKKLLVKAIRINPQTWSNWIHIRMELLGCATDDNSIIDVRLTDGATANEGRVELKINGEYGTVCDDEFDDNAAMVVCKQLGYTTFASWTTIDGATGPIHLDNVRCTGSEEHILDCQHSAIGEHNCGHSEDIKVVCLSETDPTVEGDLRLNGELEGRLEVYYQGLWGAICDDAWGFQEANVACKQLGFPGAKQELTDGSTDGKMIVLDDFGCLGTETRLVDCPKSQWNEHNCGDTEAAGVVCFPKDAVPPAVRLVNANGIEGTNQGRVEIMDDQGNWGTVCDDDWGIKDGDVVCRQLGFENGALTISTGATYGEGTGNIILDDVNCVGSEAGLAFCLHAGFGVSNCRHHEDAGVTCNLATPETVEVRLVGGNTPLEGRVEVTVGSYGTGTICDDSWDIKDATVICRMLGYEMAAEANSEATYGPGSGIIMLDDVQCMGTEETVADCLHRGYTTNDCSHSEDAGVICLDEPAPLAVRLADTTSPTSGRVEVYVKGQWGTICDDQWDTQDANVICNMLGFNGAIEALSGENTDDGSEIMPIHFDDVECLGTESAIELCDHAGIGKENCGHTEDAGVRCQPWLDGDLKLVGGTTANEGKLLVYYDDEWGLVCNNNFDAIAANVACRQLGFMGVGHQFSTDDTFATETLYDFVLDSLICAGEEEKLSDCPNRGWRQTNCLINTEAIELVCASLL